MGKLAKLDKFFEIISPVGTFDPVKELPPPQECLKKIQKLI